MLTKEETRILRSQGTEKPFSSHLLQERRKGTYICAACGAELFTSDMKYDSGTGWPSFYDSIPNRVETRIETPLGSPRIEYHCTRCGGHQGHIFEDGPPPTGLRYCNNGLSLKFVPEQPEV